MPEPKFVRPEFIDHLNGTQEINNLNFAPPSSLEHFVTNCFYVLLIKGFSIDRDKEAVLLKHHDDVLLKVRTVEDLIAQLMLDGAYIKLKEKLSESDIEH